MTDELIKRLRDCANGFGDFKTDRGDFGLCDEAADTITALRAKVEALKEAAEAEEHLRDKAKEAGDRLDAFTHHYAAMTIRTALATYTAQETDNDG